MHADEVEIDVWLVERLVAAQLPQWAGLRVEPVFPLGTDNANYRLGDELVVRLPRIPRATSALEKEVAWLPRLAPRLPLPAPVPVAAGEPGEGFPFPWAVYTWLDGEPAMPERIADSEAAAADLAGFLVALEALDTEDGPPPGEHNVHRGEPIRLRDAATRRALGELADRMDVRAAETAWERALAAPDWEGPPVWIHGDLDARNLLARDGRLSGVIDWGCLGVGDPACDVMAAWKLLRAESRETFRAGLGVDDATWERARGWTLSQAVLALSYHTEETNAELVGEARRWLDEVLADGR